MKPSPPSDRAIELGVGAATLIFSTVGYLAASPTVGALALVTGGISYGIAIATRRR